MSVCFCVCVWVCGCVCVRVRPSASSVAQVRELGIALGLPHAQVWRQPFPGECPCGYPCEYSEYPLSTQRTPPLPSACASVAAARSGGSKMAYYSPLQRYSRAL